MVGFIFVILFSLNNCWSDNSSSNNDTVNTESYIVQSDQMEKGIEVQNEDQIQPENAPFYQIENNIDSIIVHYWNAVDSDYDSYDISYSFVSKKMAVFVEYLKNHPVYYIDSIEHINLFLASIDVVILWWSIREQRLKATFFVSNTLLNYMDIDAKVWLPQFQFTTLLTDESRENFIW